jgi:hypothetical protein
MIAGLQIVIPYLNLCPRYGLLRFDQAYLSRRLASGIKIKAVPVNEASSVND